MIATVGMLGPLPRSDNPLQATCTLGTCQTSMMSCQKDSEARFLSDPEIVALKLKQVNCASIG